MGKPVSWIDKERLFDFYVNQNLTQYQIAEIFDKNQTSVYRLMVKWGIPSRERFVVKCVKCGREFHTDGPNARHCSKRCYYKDKYYKEKDRHKETHKKSNISLRKKYRTDFFHLYGTKCVCCGVDILDLLTLDHVLNDGKSDREKYSSSYKIYRIAVEKYRPDLFQVLCWNCNMGKAIHGICPHKRSNPQW